MLPQVNERKEGKKQVSLLETLLTNSVNISTGDPMPMFFWSTAKCMPRLSQWNSHQNNECCLPPPSGWFVSTSLTFQYFYIWFLWDESHRLLIYATVSGLLSILEIFQPIVIPYVTELYNHKFIFCSFWGLERSFTSWNSMIKSIPKAKAIPCVLNTNVEKKNKQQKKTS